MNELDKKHKLRDELLIKVWNIMRDISDHHNESEMSEEDLNVWKYVTRHSAIQSRLDNKSQ